MWSLSLCFFLYASLSLLLSLFSLDVLSLTWPKTNIFAIAAARERLSASVCVCVCRCWTLTLPLLRRCRRRSRRCRCRELCLIAPQSQCQSTFGSRLVQFTKKEPQKVNAPRRVHWPRVTCLCVCVFLDGVYRTRLCACVCAPVCIRIIKRKLIKNSILNSLLHLLHLSPHN